MSRKVGTITREEARELRRRAEALDAGRATVSHAEVRARWLVKLSRELREMARTYDGNDRKGRELLEALLIAEEEGVSGVAEIKRALAAKVRKQRAA